VVIDQASETLHHSKSRDEIDASRDVSVPESRKRDPQKLSSSSDTAKARKSDSVVNFPREKHGSSSRLSASNSSVGRYAKSSHSMERVHRRSTGSSEVGLGRREDSIALLAAERKRLEKENREKKRLLEELKKQEKLIEAATKKGGEWAVDFITLVVY